jgi:hypothetical protein
LDRRRRSAEVSVAIRVSGGDRGRRAEPTRVDCRGVACIGADGVGAAIANAVSHATGVHVCDLPITLDRTLQLST